MRVATDKVYKIISNLSITVIIMVKGSIFSVRSLASVSLVKSLSEQSGLSFNYFTVDFDEV